VCGDLKPGQNPLLYQKVLAGIITGAVAITVANPTDVVKVRLQSQPSGMSEANRYKGSFDCYQKIIKNEGVKGLWTSWTANVMRNSVINACELASYDQYKQMLI
jgi:solute carrier family 25 uncoupling protein 8/9